MVISPILHFRSPRLGTNGRIDDEGEPQPAEARMPMKAKGESDVAQSGADAWLRVLHLHSIVCRRGAATDEGVPHWLALATCRCGDRRGQHSEFVRQRVARSRLCR